MVYLKFYLVISMLVALGALAILTSIWCIYVFTRERIINNKDNKIKIRGIDEEDNLVGKYLRLVSLGTMIAFLLNLSYMAIQVDTRLKVNTDTTHYYIKGFSATKDIDTNKIDIEFYVTQGDNASIDIITISSDKVSSKDLDSKEIEVLNNIEEYQVKGWLYNDWKVIQSDISTEYKFK